MIPKKSMMVLLIVGLLVVVAYAGTRPPAATMKARTNPQVMPTENWVYNDEKIGEATGIFTSYPGNYEWASGSSMTLKVRVSFDFTNSHPIGIYSLTGSIISTTYSVDIDNTKGSVVPLVSSVSSVRITRPILTGLIKNDYTITITAPSVTVDTAFSIPVVQTYRMNGEYTTLSKFGGDLEGGSQQAYLSGTIKPAVAPPPVDPGTATGTLRALTGASTATSSASGPIALAANPGYDVYWYDVPIGTYTVTMTRAGYETQTKTVTVTEGATVTAYAGSWIETSDGGGNGGGDGGDGDGDDGGDGDDTAYVWLPNAIYLVAGGLIAAVLIFAFAPGPPNIKAFIAMLIALAAVVAAHFINTGVI